MSAPQMDGAQSRVGKRPLAVPDGVNVQIQGTTVSVKGPKGELARALPEDVTVEVADKTVKVVPKPGTGRRGKQYQGLSRALIGSMLEGVSNGFGLSLDLVGVGYRAEVKGQQITMSLGLSHQVNYTLPDSVAARVETIDEGGLKRPRVHLSSYDKQALGQTAARLKSFRPPEPYKGKGVRYTGERIREKAGKAGGKG